MKRSTSAQAISDSMMWHVPFSTVPQPMEQFCSQTWNLRLQNRRVKDHWTERYYLECSDSLSLARLVVALGPMLLGDLFRRLDLTRCWTAFSQCCWHAFGAQSVVRFHRHCCWRSSILLALCLSLLPDLALATTLSQRRDALHLRQNLLI